MVHGIICSVLVDGEGIGQSPMICISPNEVKSKQDNQGFVFRSDSNHHGVDGKYMGG